MERKNIQERKSWQEKVKKLGFDFHTEDGIPYWNESACYVFDSKEADNIQKATSDLWQMYLEATHYVIINKLYDNFYIPDFFIKYLEDSWFNKTPSLYGRFDLVYKDGEIKLLEFNADTPALLIESGIIQHEWLQEFDISKKQINNISKEMIRAFTDISNNIHNSLMHFSYLDHPEDISTVIYISSFAKSVGINTKMIEMKDIGWDTRKQIFVDNENVPIKNIFKFYPYEWMLSSEFSKNIVLDKSRAQWIEPAWKMIMSSKALLPILWKLYPDHPNLLASYFDCNELKDYARKPFLCRGGEQIELYKGGMVIEKNGEIHPAHCIYQQLYELPDFGGHHPIIGSWIIGGRSSGIGIRESDGLITNKNSTFVPHYIIN